MSTDKWSIFVSNRSKNTKYILLASYVTLAVEIIQGVFFVPLYLDDFGARMYGFWLGTGGLVSMFSFFDLGITSLMIQRISNVLGKKKYDLIPKYIVSGFVIHTFSMILLLILALFLSSQLASFFSFTTLEEPILVRAFIWASVATIFILLNNGISGMINALQKSSFSVWVQTASSILGVTGILYGLYNNMSVLSIPFGYLVKALLGLIGNSILLAILLFKNNLLKFSFDREIFKDYVSLTPTLFFSKLGTGIVGNIEPTIIIKFLSPEIAVMFSVTKKAAGLITSVLDRFNGALFPSLGHHYAESALENFKATLFSYFRNLSILATAMFAFYVILNAWFVNLWVGSDQYLGTVFTGLLALSAVLAFFSNTSSYLLGAVGDIKTPSLLVASESFIKLGLLFLFVPLFNFWGIPIAIILDSFIFIIIYQKRWFKIVELEIIPNLISLFFTKSVKAILGLIIFSGTMSFGIYIYDIELKSVLGIVFLVSSIIIIGYTVFSNIDFERVARFSVIYRLRKLTK